MNFLRYKSSRVGVGTSNHIRAQMPWSALTTAIATMSLFVCQSFAQKSFTEPSRALTAIDISQYLIARESKPVELGPKESSSVSADAIVEKMTGASARRASELRGFQGKRWYHLQYHGFLGGRDASMEVLATYSAPDHREFTVISQTGSKLLLNRVLLKLLDSERQAFENRKQIDLSPDNYRFELVGTEKAPGGDLCYVLSVSPRKQNPFLYKGKIWVDANDFAVTRMEGEPAKSPSFWIRDTQIESRWQKVSNFWFIAHNSSVSHIRMGGVATLTIDYGDYQVSVADHRTARSQSPAPILPDPASVTPQR
ncbi:MAG TPA: hypothetical protein VFA85_10460 [Terriglobales bacterium]|nr:hypothetical protein [Terriglobales bacterium]